MRLFLRAILGLLVVFLLSGVGVVGYFLQDKAALIQKSKAYVQQEYGLDLEIENIEIPSLRNFPQLSFQLSDVSLTHAQDTFSKLAIHELNASIVVTDFWQAEIRLDKLEFCSGDVTIDANEQLSPSLAKLFEQTNEDQSEGRLEVSMATDFLVSLEHLGISFRDTARRKHMQGRIRKLLTQPITSGKEDEMRAHLKADLWIDELTFNPEKGSYLEKTNVRMSPELVYQAGSLHLNDFDLWLDEQCFRSSVSLILNGGGYFELDLANEQTHFATTAKMLPYELAKKLLRYQVLKPLVTRVRVDGSFAAGDNPIARIDFQTHENKLAFGDYPALQEVSASGYLINRVAKDSANWPAEDRLNLRLHFDDVHANWEGVALDFVKLDFTSTPEELLAVDGRLNAAGTTDVFTDFLGDTPWRFTEGTFLLTTQLFGAIRSEQDILPLFRETRLGLQNAVLLQLGTELRFSLPKVVLATSGDTLLLEQCALRLPEVGEPIHITGIVAGYPALLPFQKQEKSRSTQSYFRVSSKYQEWQQISTALQYDTATSSVSKERGGLAQLKKYFNPVVEVEIDNFQYAQQGLTGLRARVSIGDSAELRLEQLNTRIADTELLVSGTLGGEGKAEDWNLAIRASGGVPWFNELFANNTFFFESGAYEFSGRIDGPVYTQSDLLQRTTGELHIWNSDVLLGPTEVHLPLEKLEVKYDGAHLNVKALRLLLPKGDPLELNGEVCHFSDLLAIDGMSTSVASSIRLRAGAVYFSDLQYLFNSAQELADGQPKRGQQAIKPSLQTLYEKFHPCVEVQIDTFHYAELYSTQNKAQIGFLNANQLTFRNTGFEFKGRPVELAATVFIQDPDETTFDLKLETKRFDLAALVETYDYFGLTSLQQAERVAGKVSLKTQLHGRIVDTIGLLKDQMLGQVQFSLHEAELVDFAPIQAVANKFFRTDRLHAIRFAPITDTLYITHKVVHIPRMEIQSTAFNLFVEGHLNYDDNTNIWVSLPWQNLGSWQEGELPEKTGYAESGGKLFVEISSDQEGETQYRFRLRNKRLYRHRGILDQYRIDKQEERIIRRAYRKERRQLRKAGA